MRYVKIIPFHNCDSMFVLFHFHNLTRELRRQGWSEPSAWREREAWMLTHRYNVHSDILAWGSASSTTQKEKHRGEKMRLGIHAQITP